MERRMRIRTAAALCGAVVLIAGCSQSPDAPSPTTPQALTPAAAPAVVTPLVASVIAAPIPVPATDGKLHLAYELQVTNVLPQEVTITSVDVLAGDQTLLTLSGSRLAHWTRVIGTATPTTKLGPAQSAVVWLDVTAEKGAAAPGHLRHAIGLSIPQPQPPLFPAAMTETVGPIAVQTRKPVVIDPPLAGPYWLDGSGCCDMTAHRTALNPINGQLWAAERFAIDFVQLDAAGRLFTGDKARLDSYPYFGDDIYAVGDGPVVATVDGLPEQVPGTDPTGLQLDQYAGNHIVQDLGDGNYALYAHIKTGSVKVKPGDRLTAGQVIASLGNTGNSDAPHLHFHVMSTADPLRSDGLPFVFTSFTVDWRVKSLAVLDPILDGRPALPQPGFQARDQTYVSPLVLDVMTYADR
jgi:hypothetical protein